MDKKINSFFGKHVLFNSTIHFIGGVGLGILITYPLIGQHPVRWGVTLIIIALLGHLYALKAK